MIKKVKWLIPCLCMSLIMPSTVYAGNALISEEVIQTDLNDELTGEGYSAGETAVQMTSGSFSLELEKFIWPDDNGKYDYIVDPAVDGKEYCIYVIPGILENLDNCDISNLVKNFVYIDQQTAQDGKAIFADFEPIRVCDSTVVIGADDSAGGTRIVGYISKNILHIGGYTDDAHNNLEEFYAVDEGTDLATVKALLPSQGFAEITSEYHDTIYVPVNFSWKDNDEYDPMITGKIYRLQADVSGTTDQLPDSFFRALAPFSVNIGIQDAHDALMSISATKEKVIYHKGDVLDLSDITVSGIYYNGMVHPVSDYEIDSSLVDMNTPGDYTITVTTGMDGNRFTADIGIRVEDTEENNYRTVSFNSMGGSRVPSKIIKKGETVDVSEVSEKTGFTFTGWFSDRNASIPFDPTQPIDSDLILYAGWIDESRPKLVSLEADLSYKTLKIGETPDPEGIIVRATYDDGSIKTIEDYTDDSDMIDYETPGRKEINFSYTENGITKTCSASFMIYIAKENDLCTVSFDTGCDAVIPDTYVVLGDLVPLPEVNLSRDNSVFAGWTYKNKTWNFAKDRVESNMTLTADWAVKTENTEDSSIYNFLSVTDTYEYTGKAIKPVPTVVDSYGRILEKKDYTISYSNNTKVSTETEKAHILVKGKGNYQGGIDIPFTIVRKDISKEPVATVSLKEMYKYQAKGYTPDPVVKVGSSKLKKNRDYKVTYMKLRSPESDSGTMVTAPLKEGGYYMVRVAGDGNYTGTIDRVIRIANEGMVSIDSVYVDVSKDYKQIPYTGSPTSIDAGITVSTKKKGTPLVYGVDYDLIYPEDTVSPGEKTVVIRAKNGSEKYYGEKAVKYKVSGIKLSSVTVTLKKGSAVYTGNRITDRIESLKIKVTKSNRDLLRTISGTDLAVNSFYTLTDSDYSVRYVDCVNAGNAVIVLEGKRAFMGIVQKKFKISKVPLTSTEITCDVDPVLMQSRSGAKAGVVLRYNTDSGKVTLTEGTDYTLKYEKNTNAGTKASVTINGKGNFSGKLKKNFEIKQKSLRSADIHVLVTNPARKAKAKGNFVYKPTVEVFDNGIALKARTDYIVDYSTCISEEKFASGTEGGYVRISGKTGGSYSGETLVYYKVVSRSIQDSACTITIADQEYTANPIIFDLDNASDRNKFTAQYNNSNGTIDNLKPGRDFEIISYSKNENAGKATVTLRGIGAYSGTRVVKFTIGKKRLS